MMNKTAALPAVNETNNETLQPKSIFKQKATTAKKKVVQNSSDEDTSDEDTIVETKVKQAKLVSSNQSDNTDEDATESDNENYNNNRRKSLRNSPRIQQQQSPAKTISKTASSITITKINKPTKPQSDIKDLQIKLKRIELKEVQKTTESKIKFIIIF